MKKLVKLCSLPPYWGICVLLASFQADTPKTIISISIVTHIIFYFKKYPKNEKAKKFFILSILVLSNILVFTYFKTLFDLEAGISLLTCLLSAKVFEIKNKRDKAIYYYIGFLVITGITIFNQSILASLSSILLILLGVWGHTTLDDQKSFNFKLGGISNKNLFLYGFVASSILIICYLLFPRIDFGFRKGSKLLGESNFSNRAAPGEVDELILTDDPIFVAKTSEKNLQKSDLYWIGTVLTRTDGYFWTEDKRLEKLPPPKALDKKYNFEILLKGQNNEYLFTPDTSLGQPNVLESFFILNEKSFKLKRATHKKINYYGEYSKSVKWKKPDLKFYKKLKKYPKAKQRTLALAKELRGTSHQETLSNILNFFREENFIYTLKPGKTINLDDFLFDTKLGFCTHYAAATATLLRLNDIPVRVISGFQGGEYNEFGGFYTITGKDAHAWIEYYNENKGWLRIDPVSVISPERVELGGQSFFNRVRDGQGRVLNQDSWFEKKYQIVSMYFESLNNDWQKFFYSYDKTGQMELAKSLGTYLGQLYTYGFIISISLVILLIVFQIKGFTRKEIDPVKKHYLKLIKVASRKKINKESFETSTIFLHRVGKKINYNVDQVIADYNRYQFDSDLSLEHILIKRLKVIIQEIREI